MTAHLVLTVIGRDRPGLVNALSETVVAGGGDSLDTRMANLAGPVRRHPSGLGAPGESRRARYVVAQAETQGLRLLIETAGDAVPAPAPMVALDLVGLDRPGIVRDLSRVLAALLGQHRRTRERAPGGLVVR